MSSDADATAVPSIKICKEARYYYRHREEILARQREKKMQDPEFAARCHAREQKALEKEAYRVRRAEIKEEKRRLREDAERKQREELKLEKARKKQELADEKAKSIEQKRLLKASLLGVKKQEQDEEKRKAIEQKRLLKATLLGVV